MNYLKPPIFLRNGYKDPKRMEAIHNIRCSVCQKFQIPQLTPTEAHHKHGGGIGKKASDLLTLSLCRFHHTSGGKGIAFHSTSKHEWEERFGTQDELIEITNKMLKHEL